MDRTGLSRPDHKESHTMSTTNLHDTDTDTASVLDALTFASASEQARALSEGRVSALELLEHSLARIDRFDGAINAVVVRDDERARADARAADAALARGERKPLLGVPITVKESFDAEGLVTTVGKPELAENRAQCDSAVVAALREAGAVVIGKTNVPLGLTDLQSYNAVYGNTSNPWDLARTPGGSSGGGAAAVAAGYVALEVGSDIGGSVRIPAHFTGVYGHKASYGLIATRGSGLPPGRHAPRDLGVAGPLARTAADLDLALGLLLNRDPELNKAWRVTLPPPRHSRLAEFRVLVIDRWPGVEPSASERLVVDRVVERLNAQRVKFRRPADLPEGLLPDLRTSHTVYRTLLGSSAVQPLPDKTAQARLAALAHDDDSHEAATLRAPSISHRDWLAANERRFALRSQWEALFEAFDVVVTPVAPTPAFRHDHSEPKDQRGFAVTFADGVRTLRFSDFFYWAGLPVLPGLPATSFPLGLDDDGLPIGAQAVGPWLEDRTPIAFARLLEDAYGGFQAPPGYGSGE